jgi:hypothetical protein
MSILTFAKRNRAAFILRRDTKYVPFEQSSDPLLHKPKGTGRLVSIRLHTNCNGRWPQNELLATLFS